MNNHLRSETSLSLKGSIGSRVGNQGEMVVFQKCPVRPTNAGTELHHPDSDITPATALNVPSCTAARVCFWERECMSHGNAPGVRSCTTRDGL
jgi:hypothetical protein